jgi:Zn finger protein HypA/HybF involved in hydrogenase expression
MAAKTKPSRRLIELVRTRARFRCEYCHASEQITGQRCQIDHIIPRARGGKTEPDNLCLACPACNSFKLDRIEAGDPETAESVSLFHPRTQNWHDHFAWSADGTRILGLTPSGRATIFALKMNRLLVVEARSSWTEIRQHPPED